MLKVVIQNICTSNVDEVATKSYRDQNPLDLKHKWTKFHFFSARLKLWKTPLTSQKALSLIY